MNPMYPLKNNITDLQTHLGIMDTDRGIISLSVSDTDLEGLLEPFTGLADMTLLYNYSLRELRIPFSYALSQGNISYIKKAVYTALKTEEYNLSTLINTMKLDYNPIENYYIKEDILTTTTISQNMKIGELTTARTTSYGSLVTETIDSDDEYKINKGVSLEGRETIETYNHGQVKKNIVRDESTTKGNQTDMLTKNIGERTDRVENEMQYGQAETTNHSQTEYGTQTTNGETENTTSPYNVSDYKPKEKSVTESTISQHTDTTDSTETNGTHTDNQTTTTTSGSQQDKDTNVYGERIDKQTADNSETTEGYLDTKTTKINPYEDTDTTTVGDRNRKSTTTENPHEDSENKRVSEQHNSTDTKSGENKDRELHGRYGFTTVQSMIQAERELANLNVVEQIISIILRTICVGVLFTC